MVENTQGEIMKTVNITNGEYFNGFFEKQYGAVGVPFNEAMMSGEAPESVYDEKFIRLRAAFHGVSEHEYKNKMSAFSHFIKNAVQYDEAVLWFGDDTFCQLNMITVLALMESAGFCGKVYSVITDDMTFEIKRPKSEIFLGTWREVYRGVLQLKKRIFFGDEILDNAVELYFDFLDDNGVLATFIKENSHMSDTELIIALLKKSQSYGLSDIQASELIKKYKKYVH